MAYIGKVKLNTTWSKAEDLIKAQVSGQSSFAFSTDKTYFIQAHGIALVDMLNASTVPTNSHDGECLEPHASAEYTPDSNTLYVRSDGGQNSYISISELS